MLGQSKSVLPGRDRRGLRADRLPAVQRHVRPAAPRRAAAVVAGRVEPVRPPPAGGLRLRDHPVQLHRDRRQPAVRAGADGQHGGLEAVADPAVRRALHDAAVRGGRPAARRDQHGHRRRPGGVRGGARRPGPGRHPLHRLDRDVPAPVARRWASNIDRYRSYPRLVGETGGKDFVFAHAERRRGRAAHRAGPRRVRVPGPEVLGRVAGVRAALALGGRPARPAGGHRSRRSGTATSPTSPTSAAR